MVGIHSFNDFKDIPIIELQLNSNFSSDDASNHGLSPEGINLKNS